MNHANESPDFLTLLGQELSELGRELADGWGALGVAIHNAFVQGAGAKIGYLVMPIQGSLPEREGPPRGFWQRQLPLPAEPLTLELLNDRLQQIGDAGNVRGVVLILQGLEAGLATLQNVRRAIQRLQERGKEVVVYSPVLDLPHYYLASAADRIITPPGSQFELLGLYSETLFLKDALARAGIQADIIQISPYKTAADSIGRSDMSPEMREQINWLLDDQYEQICAGIAQGRHKTVAEIQNLINQAPFFAQEALTYGLIDQIGYEDELAQILSPTPIPETVPPTETESNKTAPPPQPVKLATWEKAHRRLTQRYRRSLPKFIGVISLEGAIIMGESRRPPIELPIPLFGGAAAGEATIIQLLRQARQIDSLAALIFHVDSPGGSALASDLIHRELIQFAREKPVLIYMGNVAASGGYYVSAAGQQIMGQIGTLTGSIGVISAKVSSQELYKKVQVNPVAVARGDHAGLYRSSQRMSDEEEQIFRAGIREIYRQFKQVVANGRDLPFDNLDPICEGRVWTGQQAQKHRLIDGFGDFVDAVQQTAQLAKLPTDDSYQLEAVNLYPSHKQYQLPTPVSAAENLRAWLAGDWFLSHFDGKPALLLPFWMEKIGLKR